MAYRKNHIATAGYLRRWGGADGQLRVVAAGGVASGSAKPKSVGHRTNFWSEDPAMRKGVEVAISPIESRAARCLDKVLGTWPPDPDDPAWIATIKFIALHLIRNPAAMRRLRAVQEQLVPRALDRHRHWTLRQQNGFLAHVTSDVFRTETSMKLLIHGSSLLASMHATLVVFDDRLLATSDQPVTVVPWLEADQTAPVRLFPSESLVNCREIRWAVDPQHALVFTWLEEPFGVARRVRTRSPRSSIGLSLRKQTRNGSTTPRDVRRVSRRRTSTSGHVARCPGRFTPTTGSRKPPPPDGEPRAQDCWRL